MAFSLRKVSAYAIEGGEAVNKRNKQLVVFTISANDTDIDLDIGDFSGTFWTQVGSTEVSALAQKLLKDVQASSATFDGISGSQIANKAQTNGDPSSGGGITTYPTFADFPASADDGSVALALDTDVLYAFNAGTMMWVSIASPGGGIVYPLLGPTANVVFGHSETGSDSGHGFSGDGVMVGYANGALIYTFQTASSVFSNPLSASNLSGTNTGDVTLDVDPSGQPSPLSLPAGQVLTWNWPLIVPTGAGLSILSDSDTGLEFPSDGVINAYANNVKILEIIPSGVNLTGDLDVSGDISAANYPPSGSAGRIAAFNSLGVLYDNPFINFDVNGDQGLYILLRSIDTEDMYGYQALATIGATDTLTDVVSFYSNINGTTSGAVVGQYIGYYNNSSFDSITGSFSGLLSANNLVSVGGSYDGLLIAGTHGTIGANYNGVTFNPSVTSVAAVSGFNSNPNVTTMTGDYKGFNEAPTIDTLQNYFAFFQGANITSTVASYNILSCGATIGTITNNYNGIFLNHQVTQADNVYMGYFAGSFTTIDDFYGVLVSTQLDICQNVAGYRLHLGNPSSVNAFSGFEIQSMLIDDLNNSGFGFTDNIQITNGDQSYWSFRSSTNIATLAGQYSAFSATPQLGTVGSASMIEITGTVTECTTDFSGLNHATNISLLGGNYKGINVNPTIVGDGANNAVGVYINMSNVTNVTAGQNIALQTTGGSVNHEGLFTSFTNLTVSDGGGNPQSGKLLISAIAASGTIANADTLNINTSALITLAAGAQITSGPFGIGLAALAMPNLVTLGAGSSVDYVTGCAAGVLLDATSSGHIDNINVFRAFVIPQGGTQTIDSIHMYTCDLIAGDPATNTWGLWLRDVPHNWIENGLIVGEVTDLISDPTQVALEINSDTKGFRNARVTDANFPAGVSGLQIFDSDDNRFWYHNGSTWLTPFMDDGSGTVTLSTSITVNNLLVSGSGITQQTTDADLVIQANGTGLIFLSPSASVNSAGDIICNSVDPANGATGTFTTVDLKTVTVTNGVITSIV